MIVKQVVLVLSATVLVLLVLERIAMTQPTFDLERLDVYRLSIVTRIVSMLTRLIQRKQPVATDAIEYEYRDAEYEYEYEEIPSKRTKLAHAIRSNSTENPEEH